MGRSRMRRGYSLEVIFEEESDFCSHLDSLDSVAIRFGVKEKDDTISVDSLVEEYQIRFQGTPDKDHVFRSLDGIWDVRDMDTCFVEWDEFSPESIDKMPPAPGSSRCEFDPHNSPPKLEEGCGEILASGRRCRNRVSRRQIVEASWVFDSDENESCPGSDNSGSICNETEGKDSEPEQEIKPVIIPESDQRQIDAQPHPVDIRIDDEMRDDPPPALFGNINNFCRIVGVTEKDTLDSYLSTKTDDTETNAYTFADSDHFNDSSIASTAYDSSTSTASSSTASVCTVNGRSISPKITPIEVKNFPPVKADILCNELKSRFETVVKENPDLAEISVGATDVKRVRAMFESNGSRKSSFDDEDSNSSGSSGSHRIYSKNPSSPTNSNGFGGVHKKLKQLNGVGVQPSREAEGRPQHFSNTERRSNGMDFAEILINDRVVIEDSSNVFQTLRKQRGKNKEFGHSTLRRSRSMGTGLAAIEASLSRGSIYSSKSNILVEEMPKPDTVKNVRTVFERILKSRNLKEENHQSNNFSIVKKSLSSIKSYPSSKIYRSESMREDFPTSNSSTSLLPCRRYGKPILLNDAFGTTNAGSSASSGAAVVKHYDHGSSHQPLERQRSEPVKFSPRVNGSIRSRRDRLEIENINPTLQEEESLSLLSSLNDFDDEPPRFVSPEVLQRIRSCGSTTTYFGGQVIAQQGGKIRRQLPVSRRHTIMDLKEFNPGELSSNTSRSNTSCSNFSNGTTPSATPTPNYMNRGSVSPRNEDYFTPPQISTPTRESLLMRGFAITMDNEVLVPRPKLLPRRISPDIDEDVFSLGSKSIGDTTPRIISVVPKSPSVSPVKSLSPAGSVIDGSHGRATPEGCEGNANKNIWSNEISIECENKLRQDGNNNDLTNGKLSPTKVNYKNSTESEILCEEGAWF